VPKLSTKKVSYSRPDGIASAVIDTGFDQLIHIGDQFFGKFHGDKFQRINSIAEGRFGPSPSQDE
jgi:predicted aspartyl protease